MSHSFSNHLAPNRVLRFRRAAKHLRDAPRPSNWSETRPLNAFGVKNQNLGINPAQLYVCLAHWDKSYAASFTTHERRSQTETKFWRDS
jgi:hypothetical protein